MIVNVDWLKTLKQFLVNRNPSIRRRSAAQVDSSVVNLEGRSLLSATAIGPEMRVNTLTTGSQKDPTIAMDADGDYVITWQSFDQDGDNYGVYAQRYSAAGIPLGTEFRVNSYTTNFQGDPAIAMDANGDFVISWERGQDLESYGIYAQRFNSLGMPQGGEFQVNSYNTGKRRDPAVAMDSSGNFVITWHGFGEDASGTGVYAQRYDAQGVPQGTEFQVNSFTTDLQVNASIAMDADGDFVISWMSFIQDGSHYGIYAQRYNASGVPQGVEFRVNTYTTGYQNIPEVGMDADGDFVITWMSSDQDGDNYGIYAQRYNAAGIPQGGEFRVNTYTTSKQRHAAVAMDSDGDFVVSWWSLGQDGSDYGIYAQQFKASGVPVGNEVRVNLTTTGSQFFPAIAMDADGDFIVAWQSEFQDESQFGVYAQRYRTSQTDNLAIWRSSKFYLDSNHSNTWSGALDDTLNSFGSSTDKPLTGDWNGDGYTEIGVWRHGTFFLDVNGNGIWDGPATDKSFVFGNSTDTPIAGDWNNDGKDEIGVWRAGKFYLDLNGNRIWNSGVDAVATFGAATDTPVVGDWNGDGVDDLGVWRAGKFYLDLNGNRSWNAGVDGIFSFGSPTDTPMIGDWNGDGSDDLGVWRAGKFYRDTNGNRSWNSGSDTVTVFGATTDTPLVGYWRPKALPGLPPALSVAAVTPSGDSSAGNGGATMSISGDALAGLIASSRKRNTDVY